jgi:hypothetical protein
MACRDDLSWLCRSNVGVVLGVSFEELLTGKLELTTIQVGAWRDCYECGFNVSAIISLSE